MTPDRWAEVERLYHAALALGATERGAFLQEACAGDEPLRQEVETLLLQSRSGDFLAAPAIAVAAGMMSSPDASLATGRRLGVYEIVEPIGAGGMGEVYRAHDTKLQRDVALKILPPAFTTDRDRLARFDREARMLAALNHPNIATIYGFETIDGVSALVLELVEGRELADRIAHGALPLDDALPIARQIAEALEAAHEQGIIHRDLKPANIKLRPDGMVKVLDFGLAKVFESEPAAGASIAPTMTPPAATRIGTILGTAAYMSPEQARGKTVDKRADIWAFGCVLFEMLTGQRAFPGEDITDTLAAVVRSEPQWDALPDAASPTLRVFLRRCLHKDPKQRMGDIRDVRLALEGAFDVPVAAPATAAAPGGPLVGRAALVVAAASTAALIAAMAVPTLRHLRETPPAPPPETRADISTPATSSPTSFALSPDGRQLVFVATEDGVRRLWLRLLGAASADPLPGTEGAAFPFWSPDSQFVAFFADGRLKRIAVGGGRSLPIADAESGRGGTWNADGVIVFAPTLTSPLFRVPASGGTPVAVTTLDQQVSHRFPFFLPDGRQFLFSAAGMRDTAGMEAGGIYLGSIDSTEAHRLTPADTAGAAYLPSGWLLWVRDETLVANVWTWNGRRSWATPSPWPIP